MDTNKSSAIADLVGWDRYSTQQIIEKLGRNPVLQGRLYIVLDWLS